MSTNFECPACGYIVFKCEVRGCSNDAEYEAWFRTRDPAFGNPTGILQLLKVCKECVKMSVSFEERTSR